MKLSRLLLLLVLAGCSPSSKPTEPAIVETRARNALDLVRYEAALRECRALARDAGALSAYEPCAQEADRAHGVRP